MGCDIHIVAQKRADGGRWEVLTGDFSGSSAPFDWRSYAMYGFLANVRNCSAITPISEPRGLPADFVDEDGDFDYKHSVSWLSVAELAAIDYDQEIEDRRFTREVSPNLFNGAATCDPGEGERKPLREFLGRAFMADLEKLHELDAERIVFGFDC
jgi:hypothetical protein